MHFDSIFQARFAIWAIYLLKVAKNHTSYREKNIAFYLPTSTHIWIMCVRLFRIGIKRIQYPESWINEIPFCAMHLNKLQALEFHFFTTWALFVCVHKEFENVWRKKIGNYSKLTVNTTILDIWHLFCCHIFIVKCKLPMTSKLNRANEHKIYIFTKTCRN